MELESASVAQDYSFANEYNDLYKLGTSQVVIHQDFKVQDLEKYQDLRNRFRGDFHTNHPESYFTYVEQRKEEHGAEKDRTFINAENPQQRLFAKTILNFGQYDSAGQADDVAVLNLQKDPLFHDFISRTERELTATDFAEALENFLGSLEVSGVNTEGDVIPFQRTISAIRNAKVDKNQTSHLNTTGLQYEASDLEKAAVSSQEGTLAEHFLVTSPIYLNLPKQDIRFVVKTRFESKEGQNGVKVFYRLQPIGLLGHYINAAEHFKAEVSNVLDNVSIGEFSLN